MSKEDYIEVDGAVEEILPGATFKVKLSNGHSIIAYLSGKMRVKFIKVVIGDEVKVAISPYDLNKGRIIYRVKG